LKSFEYIKDKDYNTSDNKKDLDLLIKMRLTNLINKLEFIIGAKFTQDKKKVFIWGGNIDRYTHIGYLYLWDVESDSPLIKIENDYPIQEVLFDEDRKKIFFSDFNSIKCLNLDLKKNKFIVQSNHIDKIFFNQDKTVFYTLAENKDKNIIEKKTWDIITNKHDILLRNIFHKKDNKIFLKKVIEGDKLFLYEEDSKQPILIIKNEYSLSDAIITKDKKKVVILYVEGFGGRMELWNTSLNQIISTLSKGIIYEVLFTKDEQIILSRHRGGDVILWDINTGKKLCTMKHNGDTYGVSMSKDNKFLLSWTEQRVMKLWDISSCKLLKVFTNTTSVFRQNPSFTKNINQILSIDENSIELFSISLGKDLLSLKEVPKDDKEYIDNVIFSKDEKQIFYKYGEELKTYKFYRDRKLKKKFYPLERGREWLYLTDQERLKFW